MILLRNLIGREDKIPYFKSYILDPEGVLIKTNLLILSRNAVTNTPEFKVMFICVE
jgi:phosphoribosylformylglycinamidine (FGAM) synthase PurS component